MTDRPERLERQKAESTAIAPLQPKTNVAKRSSYTREIADEVLHRMIQGETLNQACKSDGMPHESTVRTWALDDVDGFAERYARARGLLVDFWADEIIELADNRSSDFVDKERKDGTTFRAVDEEAINRSRLRIDTRKWLLSKLNPGRYGDRLSAELSGPNGQPIEVNTGGLSDKNDLARWIAHQLAVAAITVEEEANGGEAEPHAGSAVRR